MTIPDEPAYDPTPLAITLYAFVTELLRTPQIKRGLRDLLEIYSIAGQSSEVLHTIHDQLQALAEILTISYARQILHDRLATKNVANVSTILTMLQAQSQLYADPAADVSMIISSAVTQLRADTAALLAELDTEEAQVAVLLARARDTAEGIIRTAETLRTGITEEATTSRKATTRRAAPAAPPAPPSETAQALRTQATAAAETAAETAAVATAETLHAAAAETAAAKAEAKAESST